jgi:hypothetical protein
LKRKSIKENKKIKNYDSNKKEIKKRKGKTSTVQHLGQEESQWSPFRLQLYRLQRMMQDAVNSKQSRNTST